MTQSIFKTIRTSDIPRTYTDGVRIASTEIAMVPQRVGFGYKRLFLCPRCGAQREKLLIYDSRLILCRGCSPVDPYHYRRNLYDEGGTALIVWHMRKLAGKAGIDIKFPFKYHNYLDISMALPPKKQEQFCEVLQRLQVLENMRFCNIVWSVAFTATDIKRYTASQFAGQITLADWEKYMLFQPGHHPQEIINAIKHQKLPP